jgi:L-fuconolactonase
MGITKIQNTCTILKCAFLALMICLFLGCQSSDCQQSGIRMVDTHMHLFDPTRQEGIPWPPKDDKVLYHVTMPENFIPIAKKNNVKKIIVVQAGDRLIDNKWNLDVTEKHKDLFVGVVGDLKNIGTKDFKPNLNKLAKNPRFVGIRILMRHKTRKLFTGTIWEDLQLLSDKGLTLDVLMNNHKLQFGFEEVERISSKYPKLNVVMNHVAGYPINGKEIDPTWAAKFKTVANNKNVYCKVSALIERSIIRPHSFKASDYKTILDFLYETFGADRLMYGSDWPVTKYSASYAKHKKLVTDYFAAKGEIVLNKVMYDNAHKAYHLPE